MPSYDCVPGGDRLPMYVFGAFFSFALLVGLLI